MWINELCMMIWLLERTTLLSPVMIWLFEFTVHFFLLDGLYLWFCHDPLLPLDFIWILLFFSDKICCCSRIEMVIYTIWSGIVTVWSQCNKYSRIIHFALSLSSEPLSQAEFDATEKGLFSIQKLQRSIVHRRLFFAFARLWLCK